MGAVWLARRVDGRFEGRVAVKLLHLPRVDGDGLSRFEREGQILARLRHPNIAQLLDAGVTTGGQPYLVLEHVDGVSIDRYCDEQGLDVRGRVALFVDVLRAVAHAHANLVLHRDLKPSNILVDRAGHPKLLDFGIAKLLETESGTVAETELTQRAGHAFTPEFAAPEQLRGGPVSTAIDVYAGRRRLVPAPHRTASDAGRKGFAAGTHAGGSRFRPEAGERFGHPSNGP
jgi:serine/threonine protein kinase